MDIVKEVLDGKSVRDVIEEWEKLKKIAEEKSSKENKDEQSN